MEPQLSLVFFPYAIALGALHALEPGHAKTLTAAYLIGTKGTKRDAILLGLSVAATHSIVVVGLSAAALYLGKEAFTESATYWIQIISGVVVVILGSWMLFRRLSFIRTRKAITVTHHAHGAPEPFKFQAKSLSGHLEIVQTEQGERFKLTLDNSSAALKCKVEIIREGGETEVHCLIKSQDDNVYMGTVAPAEPHEFLAVLLLEHAHGLESLPFAMHEPAGHSESAHDHGHGHDHGHSHGIDHNDLDDDAHARAHAADLPEYVKQGERPTLGQILAFGAAGGMIPCPASITVMLLALSAQQTALGLFTVLGFSIGLAITLVGIGLTVVAGLTRISSDGRMGWIARQAPVLSAAMVILSGLIALLFAH